MKNTTSRLSSILIELVFVLTVTFGTAVTSYAANQMINSKVTGVKASAVSTTSVKISWNKKKAATGYKIYRAASKTGKYRLVKTVKKGSIKSWKNTSLKSGKTYWYKVKAYQKYKKSGKVKYRYTKYSGKVSAKTRVAMTSTAVKGIKSSATGTTSIKVSWDKKARATGYKIYRATSKTGKYKLVKTINKSGTTYWKNTGLKSGKIYWYKVKAYQKSGSKFKYTKFSTKVSAKTKSNTEYEKNEIAPVSKDIVTVNGVAFDMTYYPKETVIGWDDTFDKVDSGFLSVVPKSKINPADITYVIDHGNSTVICDSNTPNILESHKDSVHYLPIFKDYYVSDWKNMIAYVKTSYDPSMYLKYRIEIYPQLKTGSFPVSVYYKGSLLRTSFVTVKYTSENSIKWRKWVDNIEAAAWKDNNMTSKEKLSAIESYVRTHFTYDQARCTEGAAALLFAARDMNLQACYRFVGPEYDYAKGYGDEYYHLGMAYCGGHVCTMVTMNGEQQMFETNGYFE